MFVLHQKYQRHMQRMWRHALPVYVSYRRNKRHWIKLGQMNYRHLLTVLVTWSTESRQHTWKLYHMYMMLFLPYQLSARGRPRLVPSPMTDGAIKRDTQFREWHFTTCTGSRTCLHSLYTFWTLSIVESSWRTWINHKMGTNDQWPNWERSVDLFRHMR